MNSENHEIQTQAVMTMANLALQMDESQDCISILKDWNAFDLGPGWDTSLIELHVAALLLEDQMDDAIKLYEQLISRWNNKENKSIFDEVWVPSWLGLARIYESKQEYKQAKEYAQKAQESSDDHFKKLANEILERLP